MDELILAFSKKLGRFTVANLTNLPDGTDAFVVLGQGDLKPIEHVVPSKNVVALRNWLNLVLPVDPALDDIQKFVLDPHIPGDRGEIVTVVQSHEFDGAGDPQVVVGFGTGFDCRYVRQPGAPLKARWYMTSIDGRVTLARTDRDGLVHTQVVPVWALRPWTDPSKPAAAQAAA